MKDLTHSQARRQIEDSLTPKAMEWWNGLDRSGIDEFISIARNESIGRAINAVNDFDLDYKASTAIDALEHCLSIFERDGIRPLKGYAFNDNDLNTIKDAIKTIRESE